MEKYFTLEELGQLANCSFEGDPNIKVRSVNSLEEAEKDEVSFLANLRYRDMLSKTNAGIVCVDFSIPKVLGRNYLISDNPSKTFQYITDLLIDKTETGFENIHETSVIHSSVSFSSDLFIGPNTTIDKNVKIGKGTKIFNNVSISADVEIGENCIIFPGVIIREKSKIGNRVILQPGCIIGSCGFGYITNSEGKHQKIEQLGKVILEDDVEIGANTTIDRARFKNTTISKGTKIDNLVQIGHNVHLGEHNIIVSQTGISGSAKTGKYVVLGGQCGVVGHVAIPDHTIVASRGGVTKTIEKGGQYGGSPLQTYHEFNKQRLYMKNIEKYVKKIESLEKKIESLERLLAKKT